MNGWMWVVFYVPAVLKWANDLYSWNCRLIDWLIEHGFTSAPTQYRLYGRRFLQVWWPNQQCQSTEGGWLVIQTGPSLTRLELQKSNTLNDTIWVILKAVFTANHFIWTDKLNSKGKKTQTKYNTKYSNTKLPWFSRLLWHSAGKWDGLILQCSRAHKGWWLVDSLCYVNYLSKQLTTV